MRTMAPKAAPATAIKDPSRMLPALLPVVFVGMAAPLVLVSLLPTGEGIDGAGVVAGREVLPSEDVTRMAVAPVELSVELPVGDTETVPVNVAEEAETEAVVEVADVKTIVEVAETDAMVADTACGGVQQERYEVVRTAVPV